MSVFDYIIASFSSSRWFKKLGELTSEVARVVHSIPAYILFVFVSLVKDEVTEVSAVLPW